MFVDCLATFFVKWVISNDVRVNFFGCLATCSNCWVVVRVDCPNKRINRPYVSKLWRLFPEIFKPICKFVNLLPLHMWVRFGRATSNVIIIGLAIIIIIMRKQPSKLLRSISVLKGV